MSDFVDEAQLNVRAGDGGGDLCHFECVGEAGALVVVGEDEHLGLAGEPPKGRGMKDAIAIAFETGAERIRLLSENTVTRAGRPGGMGREVLGFGVFSGHSVDHLAGARGRPRVGVGERDAVDPMTRHRRCPAGGSLGGLLVDWPVG